ncbi:N-acetylglucosaminyl-diphospho-decaprenol L-rhamnosyltransferase [Roseovarius sp. THAF9]|nr:N-acetylglucosaminyl-diphospho-decaprenol L-rhamnosyltransferase [Roseovarius sp. THAF9]
MKFGTSAHDIRSAILVNRNVFVNFEKAPTKPAELAMQSARVPFAPCDAQALEEYSFVSRVDLPTDSLNLAMQTQPAETKPGEVAALWVNHLMDWALPGTQTIQVMVVRRESPCKIHIDRPITVDVEEKGLCFNALLGVHRATARLKVTFLHVETGVVSERRIDFNPAALGGRNASEYQDVSIPLPAGSGRFEIRLTLNYSGFVDDGSGSEPFLFLSDVHVGPNRRGSAKGRLNPEMLVGDKIPSGGVWLSAYLPAIPAPESTISVNQGGQSESFSLPPEAEITVDDSSGHTLVVSCSAPVNLSLFVNGRHDQQVSVQRGQTPLRISEEYLDGQTHHLSLRDASGTVAYWEGQLLMPKILTPADVLQRESAAPFPDSIFPQTGRRFAGIKALFASAASKTEDSLDIAQLAHAMETVEGGYGKVKLKPLSFPKVDKPKVSIVIPAHNKVEVTYLALCSLLLAPNDASFEVIVVDDASTDETAELENIVSGITVLHNEEPQRFIRACNAGASVAKGDYIVLLNNDVEVTTGWIDELLGAFERFDFVGLAGAKLLYPDGKLQDAGGIIWGTGNPWNYGNRQNPNDPRYCYARQADYLSGAAMMVPKQIWDEVGGLSQYLEPMYFEDTDFAFKVREAGYTTWFVPSSVIYHYEGMTSGTDVSSGFKRFQEVNRPKFKRRWASDYSRFGREGHSPDLEKDRGIVGRVLFIDYTTPRPDQDAGSYAALQEIRLVQSLGYKVTFLPTNMAHLGKYTEDLQKMGVEMIYAPFYMSVQEYIARHAADFDAFYITRFYVARDVLQQIRMLSPQAKVLFNNADLHFLREIRAARSNGNEGRMEAARQTRTAELDIINQVDIVLSYNEMEHAVIEAYTEGAAKVMHVPWVVNLPESITPLEERSGISFLGSFRHHPNQEGLLWFAREIMPLLTTQRKDLVLSVYGAGVTDEIKSLKGPSIDPVGFVDDVADAFDPHRIFVAPLLSGAGIKGKVLEALARGTPCVLTPVAAEGIGLRDGQECFIARTNEDWIEAIKRLDSDDKLWHKMSEAARTYMAENYSFRKGRLIMREAFEAADLFLPNAPVR